MSRPGTSRSPDRSHLKGASGAQDAPRYFVIDVRTRGRDSRAWFLRPWVPMASKFPVRDDESSGPQTTGAERVGNRRLATPEESRRRTGGLLGRVDRILRIDQLSRLIPVAIGITWIPLVALSLGEWLITNQREPILKDLSIHVRLLVSLPLVFVAERVLDRSGRRAVARLFADDFVPPALEDRARAIVGSAERWRDSPLIETVLLVVAIASGVASLLGILPAAGIVHGIVDSRASVAHIWYALRLFANRSIRVLAFAVSLGSVGTCARRVFTRAAPPPADACRPPRRHRVFETAVDQLRRRVAPGHGQHALRRVGNEDPAVRQRDR